MRPAVGSASRLSSRSSVDLPDPLGPTTAVHRLAGNRAEISCRIRAGPRATVTRSSWNPLPVSTMQPWLHWNGLGGGGDSNHGYPRLCSWLVEVVMARAIRPTVPGSWVLLSYRVPRE